MKFSTRLAKNQPNKFWLELYHQKLYVRGRSFEYFYSNPQQYMNGQSLISYAYTNNNNKIVGVALISEDNRCINRLSKDKKYISVGVFGSFVIPEFRKQGIATKLCQKLEKRYIKNNYGDEIPVLLYDSLNFKHAPKIMTDCYFCDIFDYQSLTKIIEKI